MKILTVLTYYRPHTSGLTIYAERLARAFVKRGHQVTVRYAMRYGSPSIASVLARLKDARCERILVLPLYPQYAASTTATAFPSSTRSEF